ncbi:MAG TPA: hypothetical protein VF791_23450 [Pyrinomonadaceae bacterium]
MKLSRHRLGLFSLVLLVLTSGCGYVNGIRAKSQLNEAVSAYKSSKYEAAEQHARKALELDPANENATLILAIILQAQYRPLDASDPNRMKAEEAIGLYRQIEEKNPNDEQAFKAVTVLFDYLARASERQILEAEEQSRKSRPKAEKLRWTEEADRRRKEAARLSEEQLAWVKKRAENKTVADPGRSEAYAFLAENKLRCSKAITERNVQPARTNGGSLAVKFKKPEDPVEYDKAVQCINEGLELAYTALSLNVESEAALAAKYRLLLEAGKLARMGGDEKKAAEYERQAVRGRDQETGDGRSKTASY